MPSLRRLLFLACITVTFHHPCCALTSALQHGGAASVQNSLLRAAVQGKMSIPLLLPEREGRETGVQTHYQVTSSTPLVDRLRGGGPGPRTVFGPIEMVIVVQTLMFCLHRFSAAATAKTLFQQEPSAAITSASRLKSWYHLSWAAALLFMEKGEGWNGWPRLRGNTSAEVLVFLFISIAAVLDHLQSSLSAPAALFCSGQAKKMLSVFAAAVLATVSGFAFETKAMLCGMDLLANGLGWLAPQQTAKAFGADVDHQTAPFAGLLGNLRLAVTATMTMSLAAGPRASLLAGLATSSAGLLLLNLQHLRSAADAAPRQVPLGFTACSLACNALALLWASRSSAGTEVLAS